MKNGLAENTDGPDNPYSLVYGEYEIEKLLQAFKIKKNQVFYFDTRHWGVMGKLIAEIPCGIPRFPLRMASGDLRC